MNTMAHADRTLPAKPPVIQTSNRPLPAGPSMVKSPAVPAGPKPASAGPNHPPQEITSLMDILSERSYLYGQKEQAVKKRDKVIAQKEILAGAPEFLPEHLNLQSRQREAETARQKYEARMVARDAVAQQELLSFLNRNLAKSTPAVSDHRIKALEEALDKKVEDKAKAYIRALEESMDKKVEDKAKEHVEKFKKEHQARVSMITRRLDEEMFKTRKLEEKLEQLTKKVDEASHAGAIASKQVAQIQEDVDLPSLNDMKDKLDNQEKQLKQLVDLKSLQSPGGRDPDNSHMELESMQAKLELFGKQISGLLTLPAKLESQHRDITDFKTQQETAQERLQQKVDAHETDVMALKLWREEMAGQEVSPVKATGTTDLEPLQAEVAALAAKTSQWAAKIEALSSLDKSIDIFRGMVLDIAGRTTATQERVSKQESELVAMNAKVKALDDRLPASLGAMEKVTRQSPPAQQLLTNGQDAKSENTLLGTPGNALQQQILSLVDQKLRDGVNQTKTRFGWISTQIGQMIDAESDKRKSLDDRVKESLDKITKDLEKHSAELERLAKSSDTANIKSELDALRASLESKAAFDHKMFEDFSMRIHHLNLWRDNFSSQDMVKTIVAYISNAIPQSTQQQIRVLSERMTNLEILITKETRDASSKKRKVTWPSQANGNGT